MAAVGAEIFAILTVNTRLPTYADLSGLGIQQEGSRPAFPLNDLSHELEMFNWNARIHMFDATLIRQDYILSPYHLSPKHGWPRQIC
jgi:hypothetical protein